MARTGAGQPEAGRARWPDAPAAMSASRSFLGRPARNLPEQAGIQERSAGCQFGRDPAQVSRARRLVRQTLADWGLDSHIDQAVLISSEMVTNALRHGAGMISIRLYRAGHDLRVEVHDHGAGRPVRRHAGTGDEGGRGLAVIDGIVGMYDGQRGCTDDETGPGKTVYVVMRVIANAAGAW